VARGGAVDIDDAVAAARKSFESGPWRRMEPRDRKRILRHFVEAIRADVERMATPFGGFKLSGFGRDRSPHAIDKYCDLKTIWTAYS
jgi:acyl-CoA reductase-like NAD-dependent aldehyde dehydrogenase